jgi:demethylmenaquinone methyltransferase/2-methoxy-6-polyprenyl-1,4-benzoquinol methylase
VNDITTMFTEIRGDYDRFNRILSLGSDQSWRRALVDAVLATRATNENPTLRVLDLAAGTGDITLMLQEAGLEVVAADACEPMLELSRNKGVRETVVCPAEKLPFPDRSFDTVTIGWGYRNFSDRAASLKEIARVLRPDGHLFILECSQPHPLLRPFHHFYMSTISPAIVGWMGGDADAYRYLASSTAAFPDAPTLGKDLEAAGFDHVTWKKFALGAIALHTAERISPAQPSAPQAPRIPQAEK